MNKNGGKYLLGHFLPLNYLTLGSLDSNKVAKRIKQQASNEVEDESDQSGLEPRNSSRSVTYIQLNFNLHITLETMKGGLYKYTHKDL